MNDRRRSRTITEGSHNAFHRAFLYGTGLSSEEIDQPFVGIGVAWSEASDGSSEVRSLADLVKTATWAAQATPREFLVPVTDAWSASRATRELVADSTELVIRGHWYDAVVGVAAAPGAIYGLAMAILRLRVPGIVAVPAGVAGEGAVALSFLDSLGLGWQPVEREASAGATALRATLAELTDTDGPSAADVVRSRCEQAPRSVQLPPVSTGGLMHAAAVLHEVGVSSLLPLLTAPHEPSDGGATATTPSPRLARLVDGGTAVAHGLFDLGPGTASAPADVTLHDDPGAPTLRLGERTLHLATLDQLLERPPADRFVVLADDLPRGSRRQLRLVPVAGDSPGLDADVSDRLASSAVGRTTHPGLVDSELRYDRL